MKNLNNPKFNFIIIVCLLLVGITTMPVMAQDEPEATPTVEVDVQNWVDDLIEFFTDSNIIQILTGAAILIYAISQIKKPQTLTEYERNKTDIRRRQDDAALTETKVDDITSKIEELLNELRPRVGDASESPFPSEPSEEPKVVIDKPIPEKWMPINDNPQLDQLGDNGMHYYERTEGTRKIAVPHNFKYIGSAGAVDGTASVHPDTFYRPGQGFEMALADKAGKFGWVFNLDNFVLAERSRYAIVLQYNANFTPLTDGKGNPTVRLVGQIIHDGNERWELPEKMVMSGTNEAQWVFQVSKDYADLDVLLQVFMPYGAVDDHGTLLIKQIRVVPVPDNYGENAVIRV